MYNLKLNVLPISLLFLLAPFPIVAQTDGKSISKIIEEIASDKYQGRETGTEGSIMTEDYFAGNFERLNLIPVGDSGTYYHHYIIPEPESSVKATLVIDDRTFYQGFNEDFSVLYKSAPGAVSGEIVFAGYGIYNPEKNRNDFDSIDIRNKIVLIKRGAPRNDMAGWIPSSIDSVKAEYCYRHGALGVLFFEPLIRSNQRVLRESLGNHLAMVSVLPAFPVFSVDERVVRFVFAKAGQSYYRVINLLENQSQPFTSGVTCAMTAQSKTQGPIRTRNVLGMIEGCDSILKKEYVIIGGHIDHIGSDESGKVWNGADDNASGSAVVLGIAEAMVKSNFKPKRSIVFAGWTGEEMGLLGSKAWCDNPTLDLSKTVVYFNLDMVGLGNGKLNMPGTGFAPEIADFIQSNMDTTFLNRIVWSDGGPGGSDHNNFLIQGVPAFAGMTAGVHPDYHQPGDDAEKINEELLEFTADFIYRCAEMVANTNEDLVTEKRRENNKFRLFSFSFFDPVGAGHMELLKTRNFKTGILDLSDRDPSRDPEENFIFLLGALDKVLSGNNSFNRFQFTGSAYDAMMTRSALMAAFNPDHIRMDELKFKILARQGFRFAILNSKSIICRDKTMLLKIISLCHQNGVGMILDRLPQAVIESITSLATDPCLIINTESTSLSEITISNIKGDGHIIVFHPELNSGMEEDIQKLNTLINIVGIDNILLSPENISEESLKYLQRFIRQYNMTASDKAAQYKISGDNFYRMAVKSLQVE